MTDTLREFDAWLLSVYPESGGARVWLLTRDGERIGAHCTFPLTFYVHGTHRQLEEISRYIAHHVSSSYGVIESKQDLYEGPLEVLGIRSADLYAQRRLVKQLQRVFRGVRYFNIRPPFTLQFHTRMNTFPLALCKVSLKDKTSILSIESDEDYWQVGEDLPELRRLLIEPDQDPNVRSPKKVKLTYDSTYMSLDASKPIALTQALDRKLRELDPDVIFTHWGDDWLFPFLLTTAQKHGLAFNPNRDPKRRPQRIESLTFESYGRLYHRSAQTRLYGRWHIDLHNSTTMMGFEFSLAAAVEMARVTGLDVQNTARNSPGSGFTLMQIREALSRNLLIPENKYQVEPLKSALELNSNDRGGLNYRPVVGIHSNVAELDFFSMYPSIMENWNISGETVLPLGKAQSEEVWPIPGTGIVAKKEPRGLVSGVLEPLLKKRRRLKKLAERLPENASQRLIYEKMADALKWLGYVSFGYQGYKNNLFGNIYAHEAICAMGRESLVKAIETAHAMGFDVVAANVDSLFVKREGFKYAYQFKPLIARIEKETQLTIELEGIFDWIMFPPSRTNPYVGAANRYFGCFQNIAERKVRGLAQRRHDTPQWVAEVENEVLDLLMSERNAHRLGRLLPAVVALVQQRIEDLRDERVPVENLVVVSRLSRPLAEYKGNSISANAAQQTGRDWQAGQAVKLVYTHGARSNVMAWAIAQDQGYAAINKESYIALLLRATHELVKLVGIDEESFRSRVLGGAQQLRMNPGTNLLP